MGNSITTNPVVIDTDGADVVISHTPVTVTSIVIEDSTAGDTVVFQESPTKGTAEVFRLSVQADGASTVWTPAKPFTFQNGLVYDDDASSWDDTAGRMFIYLK